MRRIDWGALVALALAIIGFAVFLGALNARVDGLDKKIDLVTPGITMERNSAIADIKDKAASIEKELSNPIVKSTKDVVLQSTKCVGGICCPSSGQNNYIPATALNGDDGKIIAVW